MKKYLSLLLATVCVMFVFAACSGSAAPGAAEPTATPATTATPEPTPEPTSEPTPEPTPEPEFHCDFDRAVAAFIEDNPNEDLVAYPFLLYRYLLDKQASDNLDYSHIENDECENEYAEGFISWCRGTDGYLFQLFPELANMTPAPMTDEEREQHRQAYEEQQRELEERLKQEEEEARREEEELLKELEGLEFKPEYNEF